MTKLSDTQLVILSTASQRDDRLVLPLPDQIKGGAAAKVVGSLLAKGLVAEVPAKPNQPVWREDDDLQLTLVATDAAFAALGIAPEDAPQGGDHGSEPTAIDKHPKALANEASWDNLPDHGAPSGAARKGRARRGAKRTNEGAAAQAGTDDAASTASAAPPARKTRAGSKQARLVEMLKRPEGVTIAEAADALAWQNHTVRGAMAGALKKKLGLTIESEKVEGGGRTYRIAS